MAVMVAFPAAVIFRDKEAILRKAVILGHCWFAMMSTI